jgi:hypothetical protein
LVLVSAKDPSGFHVGPLLAAQTQLSPGHSLQSLWTDRGLTAEADSIVAISHAPQRGPDAPRQLGVPIEQRYGEIPLSGKLGLIQSIGRLLNDNIGALIKTRRDASKLCFQSF